MGGGLRLGNLGPAGWGLLIAAPVIGSFLGVVIRRLPDGQPIVWSRSKCERCGAVLTARDLVPLISWVLALGRCRRCGYKLSWFYPAVELAALSVALIALWVDGMPDAALDCLFGWWLLTLAGTDLRRWLLPDRLTLPLIIAGLAAAAVLDPDTMLDRALGAALGYVVLRATAAAYRALRQREGLGRGDAKLLSAAGAWVGATALPQVILLAALAALLAAAVLRLGGVRLHAHSALPFGLFLALATWIIWLRGPISF
jgi:leader peptidase (prepilin peptidase) / N-methyltransferase